MRRLTKQQVRRAHIAAQGLAAPRPSKPDIRHFRKAMNTMGVLQVDSVNVVERAHNLTMFSRLGPWNTDLLWRAMADREIFEGWAHMASFVPIDDWQLWAHRRNEFATGSYWRRVRELNENAPGYIDSVYEQLKERGPLSPADLDEPGERGGPWWGWADGKVALEHLFFSGRAGVSERRNFTRYYDIVERIIPEHIARQPEVPEAEAIRELLLRAARHMVVGTAGGIADYYRLGPTRSKLSPRKMVSDLADEGLLIPVEVEGWNGQHFMDPGASFPRSVSARALLNPFDPIVWLRDRTEHLYDFHYRIEIYVPAPKRVHGYYVFPFLLGDELVARVDIKADRKAGRLLVPGVFLEDGQDPTRVAREMVIELQEMASWLGLIGIEVGSKGDLAPLLRASL